MNEEQFFDEFYEALKGSMAPEGYTVEKTDVPKANTTLHGITVIPEGGRYSFTPVIYPSNYYPAFSEGVGMDTIINDARVKIKETEEAVRPDKPLITKEEAPSHLRTAVVSYEPNREWLKSIPHERIEDLAVYAKWHFDENSSAVVTNGLSGYLAMTKEEILDMAEANTRTQAKFCTMEEALKDTLRHQGISEETIDESFKFMPESPLYVLSTKDGYDGASLLADQKVLKDIREQLEENFYILPSSIHEVLILPASFVGDNVQDLRNMVKEVNQTEVRIEDQLSNEVYQFDEKGLHLAAGDMVLAESENMEPVTHHRTR